MSDTSITLSRTVNAPAADVFAVLADPGRHTELDGSGFVRSAVDAHPVTAVGDVFTMEMDGPHMGGEYRTDNHVSGFSPNTLIAWKTAPAGTEPPGWEWLWELKAQDAGTTDVTLTYDWAKVTDKELLKKISFPLVSADQLEDSLANLAAAVNG